MDMPQNAYVTFPLYPNTTPYKDNDLYLQIILQ